MGDERPGPALVAESVFCICYLLFMAVSTWVFSTAGLQGGSPYALACASAAGLLLFGDALHLIPRIVFDLEDLGHKGTHPHRVAVLGLGSLASSLTMTGFYLVLYQVFDLWAQMLHDSGPKGAGPVWYALVVVAVMRAVLCLLPQNRWLSGGDHTWSLIRNAPFVCMGAITVCYLVAWYGLVSTAALVLLSFACYMGTVLLARKRPAFGMLMIPKTVCYMAIVCQLLGWL